MAAAEYFAAFYLYKLSCCKDILPQPESTIMRLCIGFSLLVKRLEFGVIPPRSFLSLSHAFVQMQAEMPGDFSRVVFVFAGWP